MSDKLLRMATILALLGAGDQASVMFGSGGRRYLGSRTKCSECNKEIPPGRPGRKCEACRNQK